MVAFTRYAVYYLPPEPLASFGAAWLGWDVASGRPRDRTGVDGLSPAEIARATEAPRRYGFHATLKPPFRLAPGTDRAELEAAFLRLATGLPPATAPGLRLGRIGSFLALVPEGDGGDLGRVADACVEGLDRFRAPPDEAELTRRRAAGLTRRQEALLGRWGYPYVFDAFRFHMTLSGRLVGPEADRVEAALRRALPALPAPFRLDRIALVGETSEGFRLLLQSVLAADERRTTPGR